MFDVNSLNENALRVSGKGHVIQKAFWRFRKLVELRENSPKFSVLLSNCLHLNNVELQLWGEVLDLNLTWGPSKLGF